MPLPRPSALVRRVAAVMWRQAASRFDAWRVPDPEPARARASGTPRVTAIDVVPRPGPTWTDHACRHIDRWIGRLVGAEAVHEARDVRRLRTAVRRLRAIVAAVGDGEHPGQRDLDRSLRRLVKRLGDVRDLDVAIAALAARRRECDAELEHAAIDELEATLVRRRARALARAKRRLRPDAIATVVAELRLFVAAAITEHDGPTLAAKWWEPAFDRLRATLEMPADALDLEGLHAVRIAARSLRYGIGFFDGVLPAAAQSWTDRVGEVQRRLGDHRDVALFHADLVGRVERASTRGRVALARGLDRGRAAAALAEREAWAASREVLAAVTAELARARGRSAP